VKAVATGYLTATSSVTLQDGAAASVSLKLDPDPSAVAPPAPPTGVTASAGGATPAPPGSAPGAAAASGSGGSGKALAIGSFVVGGVGVVVGTVFGVLALGNKSSLDSACGPTKMACPSSSQSNISALSTNATLSTVGFGVGIVGAALGVVFLATSHGSEGGTASTGVRPWLGVGSAGLEGRFE
jgi:hypothetical protein